MPIKCLYPPLHKHTLPIQRTFIYWHRLFLNLKPFLAYPTNMDAVHFLHGFKKNGRGGIHDASPQVSRPAQERRTGVMMKVNKILTIVVAAAFMTPLPRWTHSRMNLVPFIIPPLPS